jgi:hypothetical protein
MSLGPGPYPLKKLSFIGLGVEPYDKWMSLGLMILVWLFLYSVSVSPWRGTAIYIAVFPPTSPNFKVFIAVNTQVLYYISPWLNKIKQDVFGHDRTQLPAVITLVLIFYILNAH